jgi:Bacterial Ig domain/RTX calcium-binding nonapeptide repeat (4 copies)
MPILTALGTDTLVNTNTADGQISPRVVALAGGKYMVIWVGSVILPVVLTGGTFAPAYANADIRAQIYNADGTPSGGEIVINTTTAGAQLRPVVAQLSDGNILITWHDGVGPAGGPSETTSNTIRAQEFTSAGVATGTEFAIGSSNGRLHSLAATATGGFVVTYQQGGVGGALAAGNIVTQVYNSSNAQTSSFIVDNTLLLANPTYTTVEADGDIIIFWIDRNPGTGVASWRSTRFDTNGNVLGDQTFPTQYTITGAISLATGGHMFFGFYNPGFGQPISIFAEMRSGDGSLGRTVDVAVVPAVVGSITATPLANGGFLFSWGVDSDLGTGVNAEIMAQAFNAIGNPIGAAFQINATTALNQSVPSLIQLTDGDIVAAWVDDSLLNGDTSTSGIVMRRIDFDPVNQNPTVGNFTFSLDGVAQGQSVTEDPSYYNFFGPNGYDADGDPLILSGVSNVTNGTVTLNPDGTLTLLTTPGATERLSFDYTVTDGQGGFATARATVTLPSDFLNIRPGEITQINFLANDYYTPSGAATAFTVTPPTPVMGGAQEGTTSMVSTAGGPRIQYNPLGFGNNAVAALNSSYFNLLVGQTTQVTFFYNNNEHNSDVRVTLEGWTQLGGTGADTLIGTTRSDHLSGGSGAANTLTGGAGNDWYTVAAVGDSVVELSGEGIDSVRVNMAAYTLSANVENLHMIGSFAGIRQGTGNAENNYMTSFTQAAALFGLGGNDTLVGSSQDDTLDGGDGNDTISGNGGIDNLVGGAGDDGIYLGFNAGGSTIDGGSGTDTLYLTFATSSLAGITGIEALTFMSVGTSLTLTGSQLADGLAYNTTLNGTGNITVNMTAGVFFVANNFVVTGGSNVTMTISGANDVNVIKAANVVNTINGGTDIDQIRGGTLGDFINGGGGDDKIIGFGGADTITGGSGADQFRYLLTSDSGFGAARDRITDFVSGSDRLNFSFFDADPLTAGDQAFNFVGTAAFSNTGIGQVRYVTSGADILVQADVNGDGVADMEIVLQGIGGGTMTAGDFIL